MTTPRLMEVVVINGRVGIADFDPIQKEKIITDPVSFDIDSFLQDVDNYKLYLFLPSTLWSRGKGSYMNQAMKNFLEFCEET